MALTKITTSIVAVNSLTAANIADNSIDATKIANNQILARHIAAGALSDAVVGISSAADATAITIDSSENVGIGATSPTDYYAGADNLVIKQASGEGGITVVTADSTTGYLLFADGTSGNAAYRGQVAYSHSATGEDSLFLVSSGHTIFKTDTGRTEKMRILSDGKVGIGTTAPGAVLEVVGPDARPTSLAELDTASTAKFTSDSSNNDSLYIAEGDSGALIQVNDGASNSSTAKDLQIQPFGGNVRIGVDTGDAFNTTSPLRIGQTTNAYINIKAGTSHNGGLLIGDSDDDFMGGLIYFNTANSLNLYANNANRLTIDSDGNVGIGTDSPPINDSGGTQPLYLSMHQDAGNLIELSADHSSSGELIGGIDFTNDNNADAANNDADGKLVALMRARTYTDDSNASDDSGGYIQFATKTHGDNLAERMRINHNGEIQVTGQRNVDGNSQFAYKTVYYQFDMDSGGTHYLQVPLYASYSSSNSSGWAEMDIAWLPDHASHTHLHSYKFMWGSDHTRIMNLGVISATANETAASYGPYNITSKSELFRHPTAGENNMTYLYIKMQGYHSVNKRRVITLRGVASSDINTASIGPIIDHGSTEPVANMVSVNAEIESA